MYGLLRRSCGVVCRFCVHQCLESLKGAMSNLESVEQEVDKGREVRDRGVSDRDLNDTLETCSDENAAAGGGAAHGVGKIEEADTRVAAGSARSLKPDDGEDQHSCSHENVQASSVQAREHMERGREGREAVSNERASLETLSLSLSASRDGMFEPFDTMNASTLATRSYCTSLDVSRIGAAPG